MADYLLGLDAGTTSVKAAVFDSKGSCLAIERQEYQLETPAAEQAELDAEVYWRAGVYAIKAAVESAGVRPYQVRAITISSQGETTIPVQANGTPLRRAIVWLDNRAQSQAQWLKSCFDPQHLYEITGVPDITPTWTACKILWIRQNEPEIFEKTYKFLLVKDYLVFRLTGEFVTDGAVACTSLLYDIRTHQWWSEMLSTIGLEADRLPMIMPPGSTIGRLSKNAAEILGMDRETIVVNGGMDQAAGAVGAGSISTNVASETTGAAMVIQVTTLDPSMPSNYKLPVCVHNIPGLYLYEPMLPTGGMALKWFRDHFAEGEVQMAIQSGRDSYDILCELADSIPPGSDGLVMLPYLMGAYSPQENSAARGVFSGFTLSHGKAHFIRAILEGVAFDLRQNLDAMRDAGIQLTEIRTSGGGAHSPLWNQIKADVCRVPVVTLLCEETALLGNAILASVACGIYRSISEACGQMVVIKSRIFPGEHSAEYQRYYQRFFELYRSLEPYFRSTYSAKEGDRI